MRLIGFYLLSFLLVYGVLNMIVTPIVIAELNNPDVYRIHRDSLTAEQDSTIQVILGELE